MLHGLLYFLSVAAVVGLMAFFVIKQNARARRRSATPLVDEHWEGVVESIDFESGVPYEYAGKVSGDLQWRMMAESRPAGGEQLRIVVRYRRDDGTTGTLAAWEEAGPEGIAPPYDEMNDQWKVGDRIVKPAGRMRPQKGSGEVTGLDGVDGHPPP
jgi:hypothetical protein